MSKKFQFDHILVMVLRLLISTQLTPLVKINHRSKLSKTFFYINETAAPVSTNLSGTIAECFRVTVLET